MALRDMFRIHTAENTQTTTLSPRSSEGLKIWHVGITSDTNRTFATLKIDEKTVLSTQVGPDDQNLLNFKQRNEEVQTILDFFKDQGIFKGYPIAEGQEFSIDAGFVADSIEIWYTVHDPNDIKSDMDFGSKSKLMIHPIPLTNKTALTTDGFKKFDDNLLPVGFNQFPGEEDQLQSGIELDIYGIANADVGRFVSAGNTANSEHLRVTMTQEILFDRDEKGFIVEGLAPGSAGRQYHFGVNQIPYPGADEFRKDKRWGFFSFLNLEDEVVSPLRIRKGDELIFEQEVDIVGTGQLDIGDLILTLLTIQTRV